MKINIQDCLAKYMDKLCLSLELDIIEGGGSIERGLFSNFGSEKRGLLQRGLNREGAN